MEIYLFFSDHFLLKLQRGRLDFCTDFMMPRGMSLLSSMCAVCVRFCLCCVVSRKQNLGSFLVDQSFLLKTCEKVTLQ